MPVQSVPEPEQGQRVDVRQRRYVVTEVEAGPLPASPLKPAQAAQHLVTLASVEDGGLGEELQVVWELGPGARVHEKFALPDPTGFDPRPVSTPSPPRPPPQAEPPRCPDHDRPAF
jgi:hypothetical protein